MREVCSVCQQLFTCGSDQETCWCTQIQLSDAMLEELRRRYEGCLCESCLKKFAAEFAAGE